MATPRTVHLIDALPYVFRAYFSLPESITDPRGRPVNAVRGFGDFLVRYIVEESPTHAAVAFDLSLNSSFRNEIYPAYKSSRDLPPAELERQLTACQDISRALGFQTIASERYEADDLIGALAMLLGKQGQRVVVVTSDKDLAQLVNEHTVMYDYAKGIRYDEAGVLAKWGVRADQIVELLGLAGDPVDDIPGVRGVGPKTAVPLLNTFDDLDELYANLDRVAEIEMRGAKTLGAKLAAAKDDAMLSRELARLAYEAPVDAKLSTLEWTGPNVETLGPLLAELGLERLAERLAKI
jgi:DNA polymerase I